ncbi:MAG: DNA-binding protein [Oscillospiraceae bacterium]|jgi:predicted DNA-binding protein YlxM (UPF0122 family)|nr:DNA-binding protein [Oscillospiraceae bacterium]
MAKNLNVVNLLDFYGAMLTDKQQEVAHLYFDEDLSLSEIAGRLGITRQGVRDHIKKVEDAVFSLEKRLCVAANYAKMQLRCRQIKEVIDSLSQYNQKYLFSAELTKRLKLISELMEKMLEEQAGQSGEQR